ncbi:GDP-L-fucose synthase family protein [Brevibacillus choshinensis]|uniref:GDP-L-fucose synthase n=1 Tax=Brevibacillus choshinensis TaxID=54911 RepID=A0ABX7FKS0_BRECH|nr:GDP-L-fucose synthase [Brevibacillus choshinensis]QRG66230.1 GDP-L-fucose synthase [Brevibacillus choshinensis]
MDLRARIFVAGHRGLVGSAIKRTLEAQGFEHVMVRTRDELDLLDQESVTRFFAQERPEYVFLAAAKVGGILANVQYPADFLYQNLTIQTNVIHAAHVFGVKKLLFLGSSCIYPKFAPQPIREEYLLCGELEPTNEPYALAKIAGIKMCEAYNRQYGSNFLAVMPTNLYGPYDNFDLESSHVLPALLRKIHEATVHKAPKVEVWGTGKPRREFLFVDDLADACLYLMKSFDRTDTAPFVNIGTGIDIEIGELATMIKRIVGYSGEIVFKPDMPDGTPRKWLDVSKMDRLGWRARTALEEGIQKTFDWFLKQQQLIVGP